MTSRNWWDRCRCGHEWLTHDIERYPGDDTDMCCVEGCEQLGCPGTTRDEIPSELTDRGDAE